MGSGVRINGKPWQKLISRAFHRCPQNSTAMQGALLFLTIVCFLCFFSRMFDHWWSDLTVQFAMLPIDKKLIPRVFSRWPHNPTTRNRMFRKFKVRSSPEIVCMMYSTNPNSMLKNQKCCSGVISGRLCSILSENKTYKSEHAFSHCTRGWTQFRDSVPMQDGLLKHGWSLVIPQLIVCLGGGTVDSVDSG